LLATAGSSSQGQAGLLLGLSDDVDCALVSAQLTAPALPAAAAAGSTSEPAAAGSSAGGWCVSLCHQAYLPALAYVVSGKTQRRHLLLGELGAAAYGERLGCLVRFALHAVPGSAAGTGGVVLLCRREQLNAAATCTGEPALSLYPRVCISSCCTCNDLHVCTSCFCASIRLMAAHVQVSLLRFLVVFDMTLMDK
jgi:hypothetical protein